MTASKKNNKFEQTENNEALFTVEDANSKVNQDLEELEVNELSNVVGGGLSFSFSSEA
jgi:hypothetical protein